jgi:hypothetical protein
MRIVGTQNRSELERDPVQAVARALVWRATDNKGTVAHPRGVFRGTHTYFEAMDAARALTQARMLNAPRSTLLRDVQ